MNQMLAIRAFVRLAEAGSFTKVADQLSLPRSTVSKLISDLEQHLATKLVQRTTRAATLTPEGEEYYAMVFPLVANLDDADSRIRGHRGRPSGRLRVDVTSSFANLFLIDRLPDFQARYPDLVLELGISDRTVDIVSEGVDCAIRAGKLDDTSLIGRQLFTAHLSLCASPGYLERRGTPQTPDDLRNHDLVGYFVATTSRPFPIQLKKADQHTQIQTFSVLANESHGHIKMLVAGLGIGQEIRPMMQPFIDSGQLVTLLDDCEQPTVTYNLLYPSNRHQSLRLRLFIDWIFEQVHLLDKVAQPPSV
ncbi:LysR family transcriptional regulator [Pseudomonas kurunegalensis]|uniref:LysR family transcriptional regulator n=1 Tax=Pseudomonas kurunegalensis TaxID=485880 RepID=UPI0025703EC8|nr:LysR family transcriptional regulator [Pseudomonas kurunegalensis]WJD60713.1 LysR family transcriptional regulator [Pseudomonas kurunegalensis]